MITQLQARDLIRTIYREGLVEFDSHDFINRMRAVHETEYCEMLQENEHAMENNRAFHNVNMAIGRFLKEHESFLHISGIRDDKVYSQNDHNNETAVQRWTIDRRYYDSEMS